MNAYRIRDQDLSLDMHGPTWYDVINVDNCAVLLMGAPYRNPLEGERKPVNWGRQEFADSGVSKMYDLGFIQRRV